MTRLTAQYPEETSPEGAWVRAPTEFRDWVRADGSTGFPAEPGRYHLYVSLACPWAHRTIIVRRLKRLENVISLSVVDPIRDDDGWAFRGVPGAGPDPVNGFGFLAEAYHATEPGYPVSRVTVPVLWDRERGRIVNNESADILRMLDAAFDAFTDVRLDLYPEPLRAEIDRVNERVYATVNDGVYCCGFAATQPAYDAAFRALFASLEWLDQRLSRSRYLVGDQLTEADWRLFTTLVRFDAVYHTHFKTNLRRLIEYPALWPYARELYQHPGVADTVDWDHIKRHYYCTHGLLNPLGIVPLGPATDWLEPHGREAIGRASDRSGR